MKSANVFARFDSSWQGKLGGFFKCSQRGAIGSDFVDDVLAFGILLAEMALAESMKQVYSESGGNSKRGAAGTGINESNLRKLIPFDCPEGFEVRCFCFNTSYV